MKSKILFLTERNVLVDDPTARDFVPIGPGRIKFENGGASLGCGMYFAIY
jgi:type I restriction enzyme R subunit